MAGMSADQKKEIMKKNFDKLDKDGDGSLNFEELKDMLIKGNPTFTHPQCLELYNKADTNGDGRIGFDEFLTYIYGKTANSAADKKGGRHARLAAGSGVDDDGTEIDWGHCERTFVAFAGQDMDGKEFMKFCKDIKLINKALTPTDIDLIFAKVVPKGKRRMDFPQFKDAVRHIAKKRKATNRAIQELVCASDGPAFAGTKAEYNKFYDDKSLYTGSATYNEKFEGTIKAGTVNKHDKMVAEGDAKLKASEASEEDWGGCQHVFYLFAGASGDLDGKEFALMCREIGGLLRGAFRDVDIDTVFASCAKGERRIQFAQFQDIVRKIAIKKDEDTSSTQACIGRSNGPTLHGVTEAGYNRFHDDKSAYTGTHYTDGRHSCD